MLEGGENVATHRDEVIRIVGAKNKHLLLLGCLKRIDPHSEARDLTCAAAGFVESFWVSIITVRNIRIESADAIDVVVIRCNSSIID